MIDIVEILDTPTFADTEIYKARNIIITQLTDIYYDDEIGIDIDVFLKSDFAIMNVSFYNYIIQQLTYAGINLIGGNNSELGEFISNFIFNISSENNSRLIN